jgi:predicted amidohydrolase
MSKIVTVGLVQSSPVFMNLEASVRKAVEQIGEAASRGAQIVVFGETWLAGYPAWLDYCPEAALWNHEPTKQVFARLRQNSIVVPSPETKILANAAKENNVTVVIGVNERVERGAGNGTLYNGLLTFSNEGKLVNHHRKLVPTFTERLVYGQGDGDGLDAVDTSSGRVGGLVCWEHWMPLARQTMHNAGEQIHVSVFPTVHEMHQIASRHYAFEGRCFVLTVGLIMPVRDLPEELKTSAELAQNPDNFLLRGGSAVIAPDGRYIAGPVYEEETILIAEIDLSEIDKEKMTLDVSGHYQRPDVFELNLNKGSRTKL